MKLFMLLFALMAVLGTTYQGVSARMMGGYYPCWPNPCPWGMTCVPRYWGWRRYQCVKYGPYY